MQAHNLLTSIINCHLLENGIVKRTYPFHLLQTEENLCEYWYMTCLNNQSRLQIHVENGSTE